MQIKVGLQYDLSNQTFLIYPIYLLNVKLDNIYYICFPLPYPYTSLKEKKLEEIERERESMKEYRGSINKRSDVNWSCLSLLMHFDGPIVL